MFFRGNDTVSTDLLEETGRFTEEFEVNSIALSPDGSKVATGGFSHAGVGIWDVASGKRLVHHALNGAGVPHGSVVWGGENRVAALEASGSKVKVWGEDEFELIYQLELKEYGVGQSIAFNQNGSKLLAACSMLWNDTPNDIAIFNSSGIQYATIDSALDIQKAGWLEEKIVVVGHVRSPEGALQVAAFDSSNTILKTEIPLSNQRDDHVQLALNPKERLIAVSSVNDQDVCVLRIFDLDNAHPIKELFIHGYICRALHFVPALGHLMVLLSNREASIVRMFDWKSESSVDLDFKKKSASGVGVSEDGTHVAIAYGANLLTFRSR